MYRSARRGAGARNLRKLVGKTTVYKAKESTDAEPEDCQGKEMMFLFTPPQRAEMKPWHQSQYSDEKSRKIEEDRMRKTTKKKTPLTSVLFVKQTPKGEYAAELRKKEETLAV